MSEKQISLADAQTAPVEIFDWGTLQWLCNQRLDPNAAQTFGVSTILPGQHNPLHYHPNCEELLYVVSGECDHSYDGVWVHLRPGMLIRIPANVRHNLINRGHEPVVCVISFSSGDRQTVFVDDAGPLPTSAASQR
jgi:quercetin dioxygenase-like cupin family protein